MTNSRPNQKNVNNNIGRLISIENINSLNLNKYICTRI